MNAFLRKISGHVMGITTAAVLMACTGDPMQSGLDPFAPMVFKEGTTKMPLNPPNKSTTLPFYVSETTVFKFAIDTACCANTNVLLLKLPVLLFKAIALCISSSIRST